MEYKKKTNRGCFSNESMREFCFTQCPFKKENCRHSCSLEVYNIKHIIRKITGNRPKCPKCNTYVYSAGINWFCKKCNIHWTKKYKDKNRVERPNHPCPECGSIHVYSNAIQWVCGDCGKQWVKYKQPTRKIMRPNNPCPECNSIHVGSKGFKWKCYECGKEWRKDEHKHVFTINDFKFPSTVCEVKTF